jgi:hypothetical protein
MAEYRIRGAHCAAVKEVVSPKRSLEILLEVANGVSPANPDTPEESEYRARITVQCEDIRPKGGTIDIPD